tara:strand:- start:794 stop:2086 length:1293 start_codon:yes stop_codon:yes gene_type:complete
MNKIRIEKVGPIDYLEINLNKVNVFIGPQSSGKSTIAKIISYCQWVEKRYILDGTYDYKFSEQFIEFHRIDENYFSSDSVIEYKSKFITISYTGAKNEEKIDLNKEISGFEKSKNIYIPAERNFVSSIPNLKRYNESNDNIMSFLYDWYDAKKNYIKKNPLKLLSLDITYHHNPKSDSDILQLKNNKKEISLKNASSGLQSIVPLVMLVDYLTTSFFNKFIPLSVNEKIKLYYNNENSFKDYIINELGDIKIKTSSLKNNAIDKLNINSQLDNLTERLRNLDSLIKEFELSKKERINYAFSKIIVEEPEQNLFPETQRDLIYYLIDKINNNERDHLLTITTHSPYILYALNNCMLGYLIKDDIDKEEASKLKSEKSWIDPELVSIWEINNGKLRSIKNEQTGTVREHYFNEIMNEIMDEYYIMLNYLELT